MEQTDPKHWRYKKNKNARIVGKKMEHEDTQKINYSIEKIGKDTGKAEIIKCSVNAEYESLKSLNRDHQIAICKSLGLKKYSGANEEQLIMKILKGWKLWVRNKGVTTMDSIKKK